MWFARLQEVEIYVHILLMIYKILVKHTVLFVLHACFFRALYWCFRYTVGACSWGPVVRGSRQKIVQCKKKFFLWCSISQKPFIIWFSLMVHLCKMIISRGLFFCFFKTLTFWVVIVVIGQKMSKKGKNSVFCAPYLKNHTSCNCHLWHTSVKW